MIPDQNDNTYHFTQQQYVLTTDEEDPARDISVEFSGVDSFDSILENKVRYRSGK
jgi:hypothetical protein